jgi:transcriptional regulator with XRE-family HTH domain
VPKDHSPQLTSRLSVFGANVRKAREQAGLSQEALADAAGLHRTYIGSIERGERNISLGNAYRLADALGIRLSDNLAG